jgi:hypothetical protein
MTDPNEYKPGREDRDPMTPGERWLVFLITALAVVAIVFTVAAIAHIVG